MNKINPDQPERDRIMSCMAAQVKYYRKAQQNNDKVDRWTHAVRYVKYKKWDDGIPSTYDLIERTKAKDCKECSSEATHFGRCVYHYSRVSEKLDPLRDIKIETWNRLGLGKREDESQPDYLKRMISTAKKLAGRIGK